jgi:PAS domain S-box-containing protein
MSGDVSNADNKSAAHIKADVPPSIANLHVRAAAASTLSFSIADATQNDAPLIWTNPAFEALTGYSTDEVVGSNCRFLQGPDTDPETVARIQTALHEGRTAAETLLNYRKDGTPFWNQVVISPVFDDHGQLTHFVGIQADVTEAVRSSKQREEALQAAEIDHERLALLAQVSDALIRYRSRARALRALVRLIVPETADWGIGVLLDDAEHIDEMYVHATDPAVQKDAEALALGDPSWFLSSQEMLNTLRGHPLSLPRAFLINTEKLSAHIAPAEFARLERLGLHTVLIAPLRSGDTVFGFLSLVTSSPEGFSPEQIVTTAHVAHRASLGLENVYLYEQERSAVLALQSRLLPRVPDIDGLDIAASYLPAQDTADVGGDWFDVMVLPDGTVGLVVGDVVGHDLHAAASMGQLRSVLRSYAWGGDSAGVVLDRLDDLVRGLGMADLASCVYLRLTADGTLEYSRAGHPPPLVLHPDGTVTELNGGLRTLVGLPSLGTAHPQETTELPVGAILVAYSDGLVENRKRSLKDGMRKVRAELALISPTAEANQVREQLTSAMLHGSQDDDVCLLVVKRLP